MTTASPSGLRPRLAVSLVGLTMWGVGATFLATPVDALGVAVERHQGRPLMSGFHASYRA